MRISYPLSFVLILLSMKQNFVIKKKKKAEDIVGPLIKLVILCGWQISHPQPLVLSQSVIFKIS